MTVQNNTSAYALKLTTLPGYFLQSDPATPDNDFDFIASNFGLIPRTYTPTSTDDPSAATAPAPESWAALVAHIHALNKHSSSSSHQSSDSPSPPTHKLMFLARHGQGYHNAAILELGKEAWDAHHSFLEEYTDPDLTPVGVGQAQAAAGFWRTLIAKHPQIAPERYFVSPLKRCLQTAQHTFGELASEKVLPEDRPFAPTILENLREHIIPHTCDHRSTRSEIEKIVPEWRFEEGFPEEDPYWTKTYWEPEQEGQARLKRAFETIFADAPDAAVVSVTAHAGAVRYMLGMLGHRIFGLGTGQVIPVIVRAEWVPKDI